MELEPRKFGLAAVLQVTTATCLFYTSILHKLIQPNIHLIPNLYDTLGRKFWQLDLRTQDITILVLWAIGDGKSFNNENLG